MGGREPACGAATIGRTIGRMTRYSFAIAIVLAACGGKSGGGGGGGGGGADAPTVPATITVSGTATQQSTTSGSPAPGVLVAAYKNSDESTALAMATTDANGNYSLTITTTGQPLDGFLKATKSGNADTYLYPPAPLTADFTDASVNELDTSLYDTIAQTIGRGQPGQGMIALEVQDAAANLIAGAMVTSNPAAAHTGYTGSIGLPDTSATMTTTDGRAYLFGLAPGAITVMATMTGATFKTTSLSIHADAFTTTVITE